ncbi:hypothetical protein Lal_00027289 [Lupinus albus]|nr:hypothetical protein Lal_00027289 [Lupinus albus]
MSNPLEVNSSEQVDCPIMSKRKRSKTSPTWNDYDEIEFPGGVKKAQCKFCKEKLSIIGKGWSTGHLLRHMETCQQKRMQLATHTKKPIIPFRPNSANLFMTPGATYFNEKMREALATAIMMHELHFNIVDAQGMIVGKISLTTDMWRSNHQVVEYMVITGHFIDAVWKL